MIYAVIASTIAHLLYIKKKLSDKSLDSLNKLAQKNEADFAGIRAGRTRTIVRKNKKDRDVMRGVGGQYLYKLSPESPMPDARCPMIQAQKKSGQL